MNNIEQHIISNLLFYTKNYVYLPRLKSNWFTDSLYKKIIIAMTKLYIENKEFGLFEIGHEIGMEYAHDLAILSNKCDGDSNIERHIIILQQNAKKRDLLLNLSGINSTMELSELTTKLNQYLEEAMMTYSKDAVSIHKVVGTAFDTMEEAIKRGDRLSGLQTGWNKLDGVIGGWNKSDLVIIAGRPGCFDGNQLIHTKRGAVPIKDITTKDSVLSYNVEKDYNEWKPVIATPLHPTTEDRMFKITMKDGTIIKVTENHEFFTGSKFVKIKEILLPLLNGKDLENNTRI